MNVAASDSIVLKTFCSTPVICSAITMTLQFSSWAEADKDANKVNM
jgi:hypothetical protein